MERMTKIIQSVILFIVTTQQKTYGWVNDFDQPFSFKCPPHQFISHIKSINNDFNQDRRFDFGCRPFPRGVPDECHDTDWVNNFDRPEDFQCSNAGVITGISSEHNNFNEDRRFKFQCCQSKGTCISNCRYTGYVNSYDGPFDFTVKDGYVLRGFNSVHEDRHEDRIFDFEICELIEC